jgi:hypothetical protein
MNNQSNMFILSSALIRLHTSNIIRFLVIYITEAHAKDEWPVGKTISCVNQPITIEERIEHARQYKTTFHLETPILVDTMDNTFHNTYGSWPFRFYVIHMGKLVLKAQPNAEALCYDMDELEKWIADYTQSNQVNA